MLDKHTAWTRTNCCISLELDGNSHLFFNPTGLFPEINHIHVQPPLSVLLRTQSCWRIKLSITDLQHSRNFTVGAFKRSITFSLPTSWKKINRRPCTFNWCWLFEAGASTPGNQSHSSAKAGPLHSSSAFYSSFLHKWLRIKVSQANISVAK